MIWLQTKKLPSISIFPNDCILQLSFCISQLRLFFFHMIQKMDLIFKMVLYTVFGYFKTLKTKKNRYSLMHSIIFFSFLSILGLIGFLDESISHLQNKIIPFIRFVNFSVLYVSIYIESIKNLFRNRNKKFWMILEKFAVIDANLKKIPCECPKDTFEKLLPTFIFLIYFFFILIMNVFKEEKLNIVECMFLILNFILILKLTIYLNLIANVKQRFLLLESILKFKHRQEINFQGNFNTFPYTDNPLVLYDEIVDVFSTLNDCFSFLLCQIFSKYLSLHNITFI